MVYLENRAIDQSRQPFFLVTVLFRGLCNDLKNIFLPPRLSIYPIYTIQLFEIFLLNVLFISGNIISVNYRGCGS